MLGKGQQRTFQHLIRLIVLSCLGVAGLGSPVVNTSARQTLPSRSSVDPPAAPLISPSTALLATQSATAIDPGPWHQESPSLAADSAGNLYAIWADYRGSAIEIRWAYCPAGGTWQPSEEVNPASTTAPVGPKIAVDGAGNLYAVWLDDYGSVDAIYFTYRPAGGAWEPSQVISPTAETQVSPSLAVNRRGEAVVAWAQSAFPNQHVWTAVRPVGGPFGAAERMSQASSPNPFPSAAMDDWGRAYVLWNSLSTFQVLFALRPVGGPWRDPENARDPANRPSFQPSLAVDSAGNAHAVWGDYREGSSAHIYYAYRPLGGPWSANVRVNDDYGLAALHYDPFVSVDGAGNAIAAWGRTLDMNSFELYRAVRARGAGWGPSVPLAQWAPPGGAPADRSSAELAEPATSLPGRRESATGQALLGEMGLSYPRIAADSQLSIIYEAPLGALPYPPHNVYVDTLPGIGYGGGCDGTMMGPPSGQAAALAAGGDQRCHAGDALEPPWLNADLSNLPGSPLYQSGLITSLEVDGQKVYLVHAADGKDGLFTDRGDAEAFNARHIVPEPAPALQPEPPPPPPEPPAPPILPAPTPPQEKFEVLPAPDPSPPITRQFLERLKAKERARELLNASTNRTLTKE
ncbi:MAG: hypothetical protein FJ026_04020, partial [Chloroflexi bacterium]|nr:hypothetical protein [Chloroflexota bacterium]